MPSMAAAVATPLDGRASTHAAGVTTATAMSSIGSSDTSPCQVVASPSRIVGCASRSSNVGARLGLVSNDQTVTIAIGVAITRRSGRRQTSAIAVSTTAPTDARR